MNIVQERRATDFEGDVKWLVRNVDSTVYYVLSDEPYFRASKSVDRRILCSSGTLCDGI